MIRRILYVAALLAGVCEASAAGRAEEILGRVAEGFRAMKDYTVRFEVAADEYRTPGSYAVRGGRLDVLLYAAECCGAQIAMFGHTHRALFEQLGGIFVINPGTAGKLPNRTWARLEITPEGDISCQICDIAL